MSKNIPAKKTEQATHNPAFAVDANESPYAIRQVTSAPAYSDNAAVSAAIVQEKVKTAASVYMDMETVSPAAQMEQKTSASAQRPEKVDLRGIYSA